MSMSDIEQEIQTVTVSRDVEIAAPIEIAFEAILEEIAGDHDIPTLMVGDLNEWRLGMRSSLKGLEAAFPAPAPLVPSFPAGFPVLALDRMFANEDWIVAHAQAHDTALSRVASDHLPIKAWVDLSERAPSRRRDGFAIAA